MSLASQLATAFARVATEIKTVRTEISSAGKIALDTDTIPYFDPLDGSVLASALSFDGTAAAPGTPAAGVLDVYAASVGGRLMLKQVGPSGLDTSLQPALFGNGIYMVSPGTSTAMNVLGGPAVTVQGTMSHPTLASTNMRTSISRAQVLSAATANAIAEVRGSFGRVFRGNAAGLGGFFARFRFSFPSTTSLQRGFVGLTAGSGATAATATATSATILGVGFESTDTTLIMLNNDAAGSATRVDLGASYPSSGNAIYDLTMFAAPNASSVSWKVERLDTPAVTTGVWSIDLPANTTFLYPHAWINNGGTAAAVQLDLMRLYLETDN